MVDFPVLPKWWRVLASKLAASTTVIAGGDLVTTREGRAKIGDGTAQAKDLPYLLDESRAASTYAPIGSGGGTAPDATTGVKGIVQLAGDLGGTAASPTVPGLTGKATDSAVVHLAGTETVTGAKTFSLPPTVPAPTAVGHAATKAYVDASSGTPPDATASVKGVVQLAGDFGGTSASPTTPTAVHVTGAETVAGVKTFSSSPIVPTPTTGTQAATKAYVDAASGSVVPTADLVYFDPSSSGVPGDPHTPPIPEYDVANALNWLNRDITDRDQFIYLEVMADAFRQVQTLAGAAPVTTPDGVYEGFAPLDANRRVPAVNLGSGTPDGTKFLRDDGAFVSPTATAVRTWQQEAVDQNLKAMRGDPNGFQNTATLLAASTCYALRVYLQAKTYTNYDVHCQTVGATLAANLYGFALANTDATGTLVAGTATADAASVWTTTGARTIALGTPLTVATAGWYYLLVQTGTAATQPKISTGAAHALANIGLAANTNVAPNSALAPLWGTATNGFTGLTPPATTGNIIEGGSTMIFWAGMH